MSSSELTDLQKFAIFFRNKHGRLNGSRLEIGQAARDMGLATAPMTFDRSTRNADSTFNILPNGAADLPTDVGDVVREIHAAVPMPTFFANSTPVAPVEGKTDFIPIVQPSYVPWGHFEDWKRLIGSNIFFPVYVVGQSGNGKTLGIEQACAQAGRECIIAQITTETDEDALLGGFRLKDGSTVFEDGPVVMAMERGAVLLLDELDLASTRIMCLQSVLNNGTVYIKKINRKVIAKPGFQVFATGNTNGKGSSDGRFVGANTLNEAFLDRLPLTFIQPYPPESVELDILSRISADLFATMYPSGPPSRDIARVGDFIRKIVKWANNIRKSFDEEAITETISSRRLTSCLKAFMIFGYDKRKAINAVVDRFDHENRTAFIEVYRTIDADFANETATVQPAPTPVTI